MQMQSTANTFMQIHANNTHLQNSEDLLCRALQLGKKKKKWIPLWRLKGSLNKIILALQSYQMRTDCVILAVPLMLTWELDKVAAVSELLLEHLGTDYGYRRVRGPIEIRSYYHKSSDRSTRLLFLRWAAAWLSSRPSLSQTIAPPSRRLSRSPAVRRAARLRAERRCSERHWTAQCGGASLESYKVLSLSPSRAKVQLRPLWLLSLVPQPPQQVPTRALWAAHPSVPPPSAKKKGCFPTIPW